MSGPNDDERKRKRRRFALIGFVPSALALLAGPSLLVFLTIQAAPFLGAAIDRYDENTLDPSAAAELRRVVSMMWIVFAVGTVLGVTGGALGVITAHDNQFSWASIVMAIIAGVLSVFAAF